MNVNDPTTRKISLPIFLSVNSLKHLMLFLGIDLNIGTELRPNWITPTPVNSKDMSELSQNTFTQAKNSTWMTSYYVYNGGILDISLGTGVDLKQIRVKYLRTVIPVNYGTLVDYTDLQINSVSAICYSPRLLYNGVIRFRGEELIILNRLLFTQGSIVKDFSIVDIDPLMIDVIAPMAAAHISGAKMGVLNSNEKQ